jgi:hypothetical protein
VHVGPVLGWQPPRIRKGSVLEWWRKRYHHIRLANWRSSTPTASR